MALLFEQAVDDDQTFSCQGKRALQIAPVERPTRAVVFVVPRLVVFYERSVGH